MYVWMDGWVGNFFGKKHKRPPSKISFQKQTDGAELAKIVSDFLVVN
jgi:hypothetical protein